MKYPALLTALIVSINCYSQDIPSDSIIFCKVFGKTDKCGITYSCKYDGESVFGYDDVVYRVGFVKKVKIDNKDLILTILEAPYGLQHGHQLGYQNIYFLKSLPNDFVILDSIKSEGLIPIGDERDYEIVNIGKNRQALIFTFQSSGNSHFEKTKIINLLELNKITELFTINLEYDNSEWNVPDSESDDCKAERYEESYYIIPNEKDWHDIKIHPIDYKFSKGCQDYFISSEKDMVYTFFNGKYIEKIKN